MKKNLKIAAVAVSIIIVLVVAFVAGGKNTKKSDTAAATSSPTAVAASADENTPEPSVSPAGSLPPSLQPTASAETSASAGSSGKEPAEVSAPSREQSSTENDTVSEKVTDEYLTEPVPTGVPEPVEPQDQVISNNELSCTLTVRCDSILSDMTRLKQEKRSLIPADGVIFPAGEVVFYDGESVFNLLQREMKKNKIHMEFKKTPIYNSAYIEGIDNIYEFDCGELSGWMYSVNGKFPNYGCSRCKLSQGDKIEWVYTCDLGADVGGDYASQKGK